MEARLAELIVPGRWPIARSSRWNRALAAGRVSLVCLGEMTHLGRGGYFDAEAFTPDRQSYLKVTASTMLGIIEHAVGETRPLTEAGDQALAGS